MTKEIQWNQYPAMFTNGIEVKPFDLLIIKETSDYGSEKLMAQIAINPVRINDNEMNSVWKAGAGSWGTIGSGEKVMRILRPRSNMAIQMALKYTSGIEIPAQGLLESRMSDYEEIYNGLLEEKREQLNKLDKNLEKLQDERDLLAKQIQDLQK